MQSADALSNFQCRQKQTKQPKHLWKSQAWQRLRLFHDINLKNNGAIVIPGFSTICGYLSSDEFWGYRWKIYWGGCESIANFLCGQAGFFYISVSPLGNRLCRIQDLHGHFPGSGNARGLVQASFPQFCTCTTDRQHRWKNPQGILPICGFCKVVNNFCQTTLIQRRRKKVQCRTIFPRFLLKCQPLFEICEYGLILPGKL